MKNSGNINAIIVDDESLSIDVIEEYLKTFENIVITGKFTKSKLAIETIKKERPELLFLDIQTPKVNGFELIESIQEFYNPYIIFVTAYDQYAIKAFETNALGYILKPIDEQKFKICVQKAINQLKENKLQDLKGLLTNHISNN